MRDDGWPSGWSAALNEAAQGIAPVIEERRGTTLRDTRAVARRLGASAVALFVRHGFDAVKIGDIAAHAGVTSRTFFRYFPSKETVIIDIYDQTNVRLVELIETKTAPIGDVLPTLTEAVVQWCEEHGELFSALVKLSDDSEPLMAATLKRSVVWEAHLAEALRVRFPDLDPADAKIWASVGWAMIRRLQMDVAERDVDYADAARSTFARYAELTKERRPRRVPAASRRAQNAV